MSASSLLKRSAALTVMAASLTACATGADPRDPLENFNRGVFTFNDNLDRVALKPAATAYQAVVPDLGQQAIGNFFGNISDAWTALNELLQGNMADGVTDVVRVAVNTTLGVGGLVDLGSMYGMPKHKQDFGATLGVWGVGSGPYVVLPFFGSSTVRDTAALPVDLKGDLWQEKNPVRWRNTGSVVRVIDQRAALLNASNLLEDAALDRYEFVRDAYLQRRESKIKRSRDDAFSMGPGPGLDPGTSELQAPEAQVPEEGGRGAVSPAEKPVQKNGPQSMAKPTAGDDHISMQNVPEPVRANAIQQPVETETVAEASAAPKQ